MNTMHVYHLSSDYLGESVIFSPRVPELVHCSGKEDVYTPRICVAPTIIGCIMAIGLSLPFNDATRIIHVYEADINTKYLYQPSIREVPDVWYTGELWIKDIDIELHLTKKLKFYKQYNLPNCPYARYILCPIDEDEVVDRIVATPIYGDNGYNFSYIDLDLHKKDEAIQYAEENNYLSK